jgi:hypothetical protein
MIHTFDYLFIVFLFCPSVYYLKSVKLFTHELHMMKIQVHENSNMVVLLKDRQ